MLNEDVIKNKLAAMSEYLPQIMPYLEKYRRGELSLSDQQIFVVERLFQLIADAAIDINTHIITRKKLESPDDYEGTFRIVGKNGIIPLELAEKISGSVGLRNRLVHGYEKVQRKIVMDDISSGIGQYVEYVKHISAFLDKQGRQNGFAPIVWIIIAAVILAGGYAAYRTYNKPVQLRFNEVQSGKQPTTDNLQQKEEKNTETANWKTYRNEEYGFEFRYPSLWKIDELSFGTNYSVCFNPYPPAGDCKDGLVIVTSIVNLSQQLAELKRVYYSFPETKSWQANNNLYFLAVTKENKSLVNDLVSTFKFTK